VDDDQDGGWVSVSSGTGAKGRKMVVVVVVVSLLLCLHKVSFLFRYVKLPSVL